MSRKFSHISEENIRNIIKSVVLLKEPKTQVAVRLGIHHSTVIYHTRKYERLPRSRVIALITPVCELCACTSLKCQQCGKYADNIMSNEYQEIYRLREEVRELKISLKRFQENSIVSTDPVFPVVGLAA